MAPTTPAPSNPCAWSLTTFPLGKIWFAENACGEGKIAGRGGAGIIGVGDAIIREEKENVGVGNGWQTVRDDTCCAAG